MEKPRDYYTVKAMLKREGYHEVAECDNYIWSILDYMSCQDDEKYTIFNWLDDTKKNYPGDLLGYSLYGYVATSYDKVKKMVEDINDFTDSIKAESIPMRIGFYESESGNVYVVPIYEEDRERFKIARDYILEILWQD